MVVVLSGGAGGGRFCRGVVRAIPPNEVTIVCNTADDIDVYGVRVCPDVDLVTFTLAGCVDQNRGYGLDRDTRTILNELRSVGVDAWFDLGDRDLAICLARTRWLADGVSLHEVAGRIAVRLGVEATVLPMTNERVWTEITTEFGTMHFQDWWVRHRAQPDARSVCFVGASEARPAPGVLDAIAAADAILIAPSNPVVSVGPILAVPGLREAIVTSAVPVVAVTPVVGGAVLRGMADRLLRARGIEVSALGVASMYAGLAHGFVLDAGDASLVPQIEELGIRARACDTIMADDEVTTTLAKEALAVAASLAKDRA